MNILQINASARSEGSVSTQLANNIVGRLLDAHPDATLTLRDLARHPLPVIDESALGALFTPESDRNDAQAALVAQHDAAIAEIQAANIVVIGAPMYNFGVTVQLKSWIDAIARARVTFRYTENGPEGLLTGKKVYIALSRGGLFKGSERDTQVPYLRAVLGFLGLTDVEFIYAEGLGMGDEAVSKAIAQAKQDIEALVL